MVGVYHGHMTESDPIHDDDMSTYESWTVPGGWSPGCDIVTGVVSVVAGIGESLGFDPIDPASWGMCTYGEGLPVGVCPDALARADTCNGWGMVEFSPGGDSASTVMFGHVTCAMVTVADGWFADDTPIDTYAYHYRTCRDATWCPDGAIRGVPWPGPIGS